MSPRSSSAARALPQYIQARPGPATAPTRKVHLQLVAAPLQARSRVPFLVVCMVVLAAALLGALLLNTTMQRASFQMSDIRQQISEAEQDSQDLEAQVRNKEATLADQARALGMIEADTPHMLRLSDGTVFGGAGTP